MHAKRHLLALCGLAACTAAAFYGWSFFSLESQPATAAVAAQAINHATWPSYENSVYRYSLRYPPDLSAQEYPEADGAMSTVFSNTTTGQGFQVYATPYEHAAITKERLALDLSSGVMDNAGDLSVDGARARTFFSTNDAMGGTYEVWVINEGFLYEIVTHDVHATWLDAILETWHFL